MKGTIDSKVLRSDVEVSNEIMRWEKGNNKYLNLITIPYNSPDVFVDVILHFVNAGKHVLYITAEAEEHIKIIQIIRTRTAFRGYAYMRQGKYNIAVPLVISSHQNAQKFNGIYDLVIYDDISSVPQYSKKSIKELIRKRISINSKVIGYATEDIFEDSNAQELRIPVGRNKKPFVEPRIITTRLDLHKSIPIVFYDYIKWLLASGKKIIIYAPDNDKVIQTYENIVKSCIDLCDDIFYYQVGNYQPRIIHSFMKNKLGILITNEFDDESYIGNNTSIMVYYADNEVFDYKKLLYFCGKTGWGENSFNGEVIFLANTETKAMEKAKSTARRFNKEAWELGLLNF